MSMLSEIFGFLEALFEDLGNLLDPYPKKKSRGSAHNQREKESWTPKELSDAYVAAKDDPGQKYWQGLLNEKLDAKEKENEMISRMAIEDYESRHASGGSDAPEENTESSEEFNSSEQETDSGAFESDAFESDFDADSGDCDSDSDGSSSGSDSYIG